MKKLNKLFLGLAAAGSVAAPIATVVSCGANETDQAPTVVLVTDGGTIDDKSFNEQAANALKSIKGISSLKANMYIQPSAHTAADITRGYEAAASNGMKVVLAPGYGHIEAINSWVSGAHAEALKFILVDGEVSNKNVASIVFNTKQPGFQAGYMAAKYSDSLAASSHHKVGTFGGGTGAGVTDFMTGFVAGVKYYNDHLASGATKVTFATHDALTNTGFAPGGGASQAAALLHDNADVILPVAGPQTADVIKAIKDANNTTTVVIGVDTDQSIAYPEASNLFLTSILKNVDKAFQTAYKTLDTVLGQTTTYGLTEGLVGLAETKIAAAAPFKTAAEAISTADVTTATNWDWAAALNYVKTTN